MCIVATRKIFYTHNWNLLRVINFNSPGLWSVSKWWSKCLLFVKRLLMEFTASQLRSCEQHHFHWEAVSVNSINSLLTNNQHLDHQFYKDHSQWWLKLITVSKFTFVSVKRTFWVIFHIYLLSTIKLGISHIYGDFFNCINFQFADMYLHGAYNLLLFYLVWFICYYFWTHREGFWDGGQWKWMAGWLPATPTQYVWDLSEK